MKLQGRAALITGGSRGIGRAAAIALAAEGCDVAVNYRHTADQADEVVRQIETLGRCACAIQADVSSEAEVRQLVQAAEQRLGRIDILVNNAGINKTKPFDELIPADWNETIATNLTSSFLVSQ